MLPQYFVTQVPWLGLHGSAQVAAQIADVFPDVLVLLSGPSFGTDLGCPDSGDFPINRVLEVVMAILHGVESECNGDDSTAHCRDESDHLHQFTDGDVVCPNVDFQFLSISRHTAPCHRMGNGQSTPLPPKTSGQ